MPFYEFEASGEDFDVNAFLAESSLACTPFYRGDDDPVQNHAILQHSGFSLTVRAPDGQTAAEKIAEVFDFLTSNEAELRRLQSYPGVTSLCLRCRYHVPRDQMLGEYLPPELIRLAGSLGLAIDLVMY